jgi:hypothetical protein
LGAVVAGVAARVPVPAEARTVPSVGAAGPRETVPTLVALLPAVRSVEPLLECLTDLPLVTRPRRVDVEVKVGMPVSGIKLLDELVVGAVEVDVAVELDPVVGSEVGSAVGLETALIGVVDTAGLAETDPSPGVKLAVTDGEVPEGSEAGTTPPPSVPLLHRPWHSVVVGLGVEWPFCPGRPFSSGIVTTCPVAVVVDVVVDVVEVPVVVVPGVLCDP